MTKAEMDLSIQQYVGEEIAPYKRQIADLTTQIGIMAENETQMMDIIADLRRQLAVWEPQTKTIMGVTATGAVRNQYTDLHPYVALTRVYVNNAETWDDEVQHKIFPGSMWACSNTYAWSLEKLDAFLGSIPPADKAKIVAWCDIVEPERSGLNSNDYKGRMRRTSEIIRSHGLKVASCVAGSSVPNDTWLAWVDPDFVDVMAFNKANAEGLKTIPSYIDAEKFISNLAEQTRRFGKPWALWETGTTQFGDEASRVAWVIDLRKAIEDNGGLHAIWFDRGSVDPSSPWTALLQPKAAAEAWLL